MLLSSVIDNFRNVKILCAGDIMLDHYIYGDVRRISPEAPVPVFEYKTRESMLGGCGNVVDNLRAAGCQVKAFCLVGEDAAGRQIRSLLNAAAPGSVALDTPGYTSIEKTRIVADHNHLLRIDHEDRRFDDSAIAVALESHFPRLVAWADLVLLSDYAKGLLNKERCERIIRICGQYKRMVIVDPKGSDYRKYAGATLIKPNLKEFMAASNVECFPDAPDFDKRLLMGATRIFGMGVEHLIVTLSQHGMAYISAEKPDTVIRLPTAAKEVYDVSGAGDTSLAILGASIAAGASMSEAMKLANLASGIAVGKIGTSTVSPDELLEAVTLNSTKADSAWRQKVKIITKNHAGALAESCRQKNLKVVFTNGCFDLLHPGHLKSLMTAKALGDILMVGLNTDASIKKLKGPDRPAQDEKARSLLLASLEFVDYIIMFNDETAMPLVRAIKPDIIAKEGYAIKDWPEARFVEAYGGRAVALPTVEGYSTTKIIRQIRELIG